MAPRKLRPQMERLAYPLNARQVESLDSMIEQLFKGQRRLEALIAAQGEGGAGGATELDDLTDVDAAAPSDGDVLTYDSGASEWVPEAPAAAPSVALDDLTDVVITAPVDDQYLRYDGANWVNETVVASGLAAPAILPRFDWWHPLVVFALSGGGSGLGATYQGSGDSQINDTAGPWRRATTGAVIGNTARCNSSTALVRTQHDPTFIGVIRTGSDITSVRLHVGLHSSNGFTGSDTPAGHYAMFRYSTSAGDAGWVGVTDDAGAAPTVSASIAAIAASTVYALRIRVASDGTAVHFSVNGSAETTVATNLPVVTTELFPLMQVETRAAGARVIDMQSLACYVPSAAKALLGAL